MTEWGIDATASTARSFEEVYRQELAGVLALAYVLSGSRWAAEELSQEAFLAAHRSWDRIGGYDDPGAWVRRVCANRAVSVVRRRVSEARALTRLGARRVLPEELPPDSAAFWWAVRRLPSRQAQVVALHYLEDRSLADVAAVLGLAEGTVKAHLHRARRTLADALRYELMADDEGGDR